MFRHFFKIACRNLFKNKVYSAINIFGMAAGLSSFIIILLYLNYELSYDKWDPALKEISRVSLMADGDILRGTPTPLASFLAEKYPNAAAATSIWPSGDYEVLLTANNKSIYQKGLVNADSCFLKVFPFTLLKGDAATALNTPNAVILTEEVSHTLFGSEDPMGKPIKLFNATQGVITGIMEEPATPSHLNVRIIMRDPYEKQNKFWENYSNQTYIRLKHGVPDAKMEDALNRIYYNERVKKDNQSYEAYKAKGQPTALFADTVPDIHNFPKHGSSNFTIVSVLLIMSVLLLLAGTINFSNLDIAKSMGRTKEVGLRKILGSGRRAIVFQFIFETALQCAVSLCMAMFLVYSALPYLNHSFNITVSFWKQDNLFSVLVQIASCFFFVILLSGLYPSLLLSRFNFTKVLKGNYAGGNNGKFFRNSLIVVQFMVSAFFIIAILVIGGQMHYMQNKDRGFSGEQVMRIQAQQQKTREEGFAVLRNTLLSLPGVENVSKTTNVPGDNAAFDTTTYNFKCNGKKYRLGSVKVSTDYFKTLQIAVLKGRLFTDALADQHTRTAIINETAARKLNISNPIGETISFEDCDSVPLQIVGVVKDFNTGGFENTIQPVAYTIGNDACVYQSGGAILVKLNGNHIQSSVAAIEQAWKNIEPGFPVRYSFIDDNFQQLFLSYSRLQEIIGFFAIIAVLISIMGLFALTAFFAKQRTKEIGIRKVLGASVSRLAALLSKDFIILVVLAIILATPIACWVLHKWLQTFAYHINISWWMLLPGIIIIALIAVITVGVQAIKAAMANPAKSLRTE